MSPALREIVLPEIINHEYELGYLSSLAAGYPGKVISLDVADPSIDTPGLIKKATIEALRSKDSTHYTRIRGLPDFVEAVSKFYKRNFGVSSDATNEIISKLRCQASIARGHCKVCPHERKRLSSRSGRDCRRRFQTHEGGL